MPTGRRMWGNQSKYFFTNYLLYDTINLYCKGDFTMKKVLAIILASVMAFTVFPLSVFAADQYQNNDVSHVVIHDPSIVKSEEGVYYSVGSHMGFGKSTDLINWQNLGYTMEGDNHLAPQGGDWKDTLAEPLEWCMKYQRAAIDDEGKHIYDDSNFQYNCWANDIIYNSTMGKYCLYGCCSVWGATSSAIWLCVSDNIEGPYEYVDTLIESGITSQKRYDDARTADGRDAEFVTQKPVIYALDWHNSNIPKLVNSGVLDENLIDNTTYMFKSGYKWLTYDGFYNFWSPNYPNCIDPTAFTDKNGDMWLVYGSYSGGCYLQKLDKTTGLVDYSYMKEKINEGSAKGNDDIYYGLQISKTNGDTECTGEGPFIVYDNVSGYYYFYLTYGGLAGDGGYNIREYRSTSPEGPYLDKAGNNALDNKNTGLKLDGNYKFSCQPTALLSGGHSSCLVDSDGAMYQCYHTRFTCDDGNGHQMRVHKMLRTDDGWAVMLPFEYQGEGDTKTVSKEEVIGEYEFIDSTNMTQRKAAWDSPWSDIVLPTQNIVLNYDGTITGAKDYSCSITSTNTGSTAVSGTWSLKDGTAYCTVKLGSVTYSCVFAYQKDESAEGKTVLTFTGAGEDNSTVWGVQSVRHSVPVEPPVTPVTPTPAKVTVKPTTIKSIKGGKKSLTVKWAKVSGANGYVIQYSTSKNFKKAKTVKVKKASTIKKTVKKLKSGKRYYVRIKAYKGSSSSKWSKTKSVKVK